MSKVYVVAAKRSAIGSFLGSLAPLKPGDLGAQIVKNILEETKVDPANIDEVIVGNVLSAGQAQGVGRQVSIRAGSLFCKHNLWKLNEINYNSFL